MDTWLPEKLVMVWNKTYPLKNWIVFICIWSKDAYSKWKQNENVNRKWYEYLELKKQLKRHYFSTSPRLSLSVNKPHVSCALLPVRLANTEFLLRSFISVDFRITSNESKAMQGKNISFNVSNSQFTIWIYVGCAWRSWKLILIIQVQKVQHYIDRNR